MSPVPSPRMTSWPGCRRSCQSGLCRGTRQPVGVDWLLQSPLWESTAPNINPLGLSQTPSLHLYDQIRDLWDVLSLQRPKKDSFSGDTVALLLVPSIPDPESCLVGVCMFSLDRYRFSTGSATSYRIAESCVWDEVGTLNCPEMCRWVQMAVFMFFFLLNSP